MSVCPLPPRDAETRLVPLFRVGKSATPVARSEARERARVEALDDERRFETFDASGFDDLVALKRVYVRFWGGYYSISCKDATAGIAGIWLRVDTDEAVLGFALTTPLAHEARALLELRARLRAKIEEAQRERSPTGPVFAAHAAAMRAIIAKRGTAGFVRDSDAPSALPLLSAEPERGWGVLEAAAKYIDDAVYLFVCAVLIGMHVAQVPSLGSLPRLLECLGNAVVVSAAGKTLANAARVVPAFLKANASRVPWLGAMIDSVGIRCTLGALIALGARYDPSVVGRWVATATVVPMHECAAWLTGEAPWTGGVVAIALALLDIWRAVHDQRDQGALRTLATTGWLNQASVDAHIDAVLSALFPPERAAEYKRLVPRRILRTALGVALGAADVGDAIRKMHTGIAAMLLACVAGKKAA